MTESKTATELGLNTRLAHEGYDPHGYHGFVNPPVIHASTVLFPDAKTMASENQTYTYGTHGTPTTDALCHAINSLEGSVKTVLVPSGLAAITVPLLGCLKTGDHLLIVDSVYHPTRRFADTILKNFGIDVEYYDPLIGGDIKKLFKPTTRVIFTESPGSNTFEIQDIPAIVDAARKIDAIVMMDNTWATPLYFRPLEHGVDISIHAATKYPSGHSDVLLGSVSANARTEKLIVDAHCSTGMCASGDDAYLVLRGLRTMGIRLEHQQKTALELARWLETCPEIAGVLHPALESHPGHSLWKRDFTGASAIFSIVLKSGGKEQAHAFLDSLKLFGLGYSWGGFESLAVHVNLADRQIAQGNYPGPVLRLQIGIEDFRDLKADIETALIAAAQ